MYSVQSETYHDMSSAIQDIEVNVCNIDAALDVMISRAKSSRATPFSPSISIIWSS